MASTSLGTLDLEEKTSKHATPARKVQFALTLRSEVGDFADSESLTSSAADSAAATPSVSGEYKDLPRKILRPSAASTVIQERLSQGIALQRLRESRAMEFVKQGDTLVKISTRTGKKSSKLVKVSEDEQWLEIRSIGRASCKKIDLLEVMRVVLGPRTLAFVNVDWEDGHPAQCFSIVIQDRTWDFQADSEEKSLLWFYGIQSLLPMSKFHLSWSKMLWMRCILKSIQLARSEGTTVEELWARHVKALKEGLSG